MPYLHEEISDDGNAPEAAFQLVLQAFSSVLALILAFILIVVLTRVLTSILTMILACVLTCVLALILSGILAIVLIDASALVHAILTASVCVLDSRQYPTPYK